MIYLMYGIPIVAGILMIYSIATKGFKGATFGGKILRTYGELPLDTGSGGRGKVCVHEIHRKTEPVVGIEVSHGSFDKDALTLSRKNAAELALLILESIETSEEQVK